MLELKGIYKWVNSGNNRIFILKDINLRKGRGVYFHNGIIRLENLPC